MHAVFLAGLIGLLGLSSWIHALHAECKVQGEQLIVEAFYSTNEPAQEAKVEILDAHNALLATGMTDDKGIFRTKRPTAGKYTVRIDAGAGHRCEVTADIPATGDGKVSLDKSNGTKESTEQAQVVSTGPTRAEVTQFPWMRVGLGLFIIVIVCTVMWIVALNVKSRQGDGAKP